MGNYFFYMRISTKEENGKQKFSRQESALARFEKESGKEILLTFKDDASGKDFNRPEWQRLEKTAHNGDSIVFKDICRFTRDCDNGFKKYMELMEKGINLVFIDNPTISTDYIKQMMEVAEKQQNRIAKKSLKDTIELLLLVELDRAEQERLITIQRIKDGIAASGKKAGRKPGTLDKITNELKADLERYNADRSITQVSIMTKYNISRNTLKKYAKLVRENKI